MLAKVFRNFGSGVICSIRFLVDVFFKDITKDIGINFVIVSTWGIVQIPRIALKEIKEILKCLIRDIDLRIGDFNWMFEK